MNNQRGFTLVELSIVLVVIGLVIGGVLVGKDMMEHAQANTVVSDIQEFQSAHKLFLLKYKCIPGDCGSDVYNMLKGPITGFGGGNDNGLIGSTNGSCEWGNVYNSEMGEYWRQLKEAGFINRLMNPTDTNGSLLAGAQGTYSQTSVFYAHYYGCGIYSSVYGKKENAYSFAQYINGSSESVIKPVLAKSIDIKIDDGNASMGDVVGFNPPESYVGGCVTCLAGGMYPYDFTMPAGCGDYNLASSGKACTMNFLIDKENRLTP